MAHSKSITSDDSRMRRSGKWNRMGSRHGAGWCMLAAVLCLMLLSWGCETKVSDDDYLIRVGEDVATVAEFKARVDAAGVEAFPGEAKVQPAALNDLRIRTLNQMTEELLIRARSRELGIQVSDAELQQSIDAIKADYPDDTFEKTLLDNAISFTTWKKNMAIRILVNKVIARELIDKVEITSSDVDAYFQVHYPDGAPEGEDLDQINRKIVRHLRQQKAEKMYPDWMQSLKSMYPTRVNQAQWNALTGDGS